MFRLSFSVQKATDYLFLLFLLFSSQIADISCLHSTPLPYSHTLHSVMSTWKSWKTLFEMSCNAFNKLVFMSSMTSKWRLSDRRVPDLGCKEVEGEQSLIFGAKLANWICWEGRRIIMVNHELYHHNLVPFCEYFRIIVAKCLYNTL